MIVVLAAVATRYVARHRAGSTCDTRFTTLWECQMIRAQCTGAQAALRACGLTVVIPVLALAGGCQWPQEPRAGNAACTSDASCSDGIFCNGAEVCDPQQGCMPGTPNCPGLTCDEQTDACMGCVVDSDCSDEYLCTADWCDDGVCRNLARECDEHFHCDPGTGWCVGPDGSDPCLSQLSAGPGSDEELALDEFDDYETTLHEWSGFPRCDAAYAGAAQVGGACGDGMLFVYVSDNLHEAVRYFDPDTRAFVALTSASDALDLNCMGVFHWPHWVDCTDASVTEVVCGTTYAPGDAIALPNRRDWASTLGYVAWEPGEDHLP